jgi:hypothetical protein
MVGTEKTVTTTSVVQIVSDSVGLDGGRGRRRGVWYVPVGRVRVAAADTDGPTACCTGPALPPDLVASRTAARGPIGPAMPAWLRQGRAAQDDDDDDAAGVVGPLPPPAGDDGGAGPSAAEEAARVAREIEDRAAKFRSRLTDVVRCRCGAYCAPAGAHQAHGTQAPATEETKTRADWMLKPPEYEVGASHDARGGAVCVCVWFVCVCACVCVCA